MKQLHMAAINKGDPSLTVKDILLFDVVPLSLGISIKDGMMTVLILRSTTIPAEKLNIITIFNYTIKVYEGERSRTCGLLGTFDLTGILPGPRFGVRNSLNKEHLANALSQADKDTINREINDTLAWIELYQDADVAAFKAKQKEFESKLKPIMQSTYQHAARK